MFSLFAKSLTQLTDPKTRGVLWQCVGLALTLYACVVGCAWWGISHFTDTGWDFLNEIITALGGLLAMIFGAMIYPALVTVLLGLFSETLCARVDALHYPDLGPGRPQPIKEVIIGAINFAGKTIALNILALLLTFIIPGLNIFVFIAVNGYLISVEYFEMVALRRLDIKTANALRKQYSTRLWIAGMVFAIAMATPIVGFIAPIVAMVYMVHSLEALREKSTNKNVVGLNG